MKKWALVLLMICVVIGVEHYALAQVQTGIDCPVKVNAVVQSQEKWEPSTFIRCDLMGANIYTAPSGKHVLNCSYDSHIANYTHGLSKEVPVGCSNCIVRTDNKGFTCACTTQTPVAQWIRSSSSVPPTNALVGGHISDTPYQVYICRANHNGNLHPGKTAFYNGRWSCFIGNGGREERYENYEIFVANSAEYVWSTGVTNSLPTGAVQGGHISDTPQPVYIGRAYHNGNAHPGKVAVYDGRWSCFIGNGGREERYETYEVLVKK
ncbi:MAG TPA: DM9 repeat-containing protein [Syntrophorhabdaceae bacterium]|jgi:hypothetical protein